MAVLPTVRAATAVALYPISRRNESPTAVQRFVNASEQRFRRAADLHRFELRYTGLNVVDRDALRLFYASVKGAFDATWSFTLTDTYNNLVFEDDAFSSTEGNRPNLYDVTLKFRQTIKGGALGTPVVYAGQPLPPAPSGTTFPLLSTLATAQRPYTQIQRYRTVKNTNPTGMQYAYSFFDAGLVGFPSRGLFAWKLEYPSVADADLAALEAHFVLVNGRYQTFTFTDPDDHTVYSKVRYDMDSFEYRYLANNQASTSILLTETN